MIFSETWKEFGEYNFFGSKELSSLRIVLKTFGKRFSELETCLLTTFVSVCYFCSALAALAKILRAIKLHRLNWRTLLCLDHCGRGKLSGGAKSN